MDSDSRKGILERTGVIRNGGGSAQAAESSQLETHWSILAPTWLWPLEPQVFIYLRDRPQRESGEPSCHRVSLVDLLNRGRSCHSGWTTFAKLKSDGADYVVFGPSVSAALSKSADLEPRGLEGLGACGSNGSDEFPCSPWVESREKTPTRAFPPARQASQASQSFKILCGSW